MHAPHSDTFLYKQSKRSRDHQRALASSPASRAHFSDDDFAVDAAASAAEGFGNDALTDVGPIGDLDVEAAEVEEIEDLPDDFINDEDEGDGEDLFGDDMERHAIIYSFFKILFLLLFL